VIPNDSSNEYPAMSLDLDKRQRAMLLEMGVRVWLPETPTAIQAMAAGAEMVGVVAPVAANLPETKAVAAREAVPSARTPPPQAAPLYRPLPAEAPDEGELPSWSLGDAQPLYAETAPAEGARWLVLAETPAVLMAPTLVASRAFGGALPLSPEEGAGLASGGPARRLQASVFDGDAGKLLDNMLRAARLHLAGVVLLAPVVRHAAAPPTEEFSAALAVLISQAQPDIVLVMGRLASQALLQSTEALGRLRGRVHALHGARAVVTYDATYLLRTSADKAKAWEDLCLAMSLVTAL
jgi:uracil-DNA glycosylase family 4